jgi:lambda family phage portal protein
MGLKSYFRRKFLGANRPPASGTPINRQPKAGYDSAQYDDMDYAHWLSADNKSPNQANSPDVRNIIRQRARLEVDNSPSASDLVETKTNDLIGVGPRLQLSIPGVDSKVTREIEKQWDLWCEDPVVHYHEKLRLLCDNSDIAGDCFWRLTHNPGVEMTPVELGISIYESEQCTTPDLAYDDPQAADGIRYDLHGNPVEYHFLAYHPSDFYSFASAKRTPYEYDRVPARFVAHWYRPRRPNQARGISRLQSGLPTFAQVRRYSKAVLTAAETSSRLTGVIETQLPEGSNYEQQSEADEYTELELAYGHLMSAPKGTTVKFAQPTQPTQNHEGYVESKVAEFGRCLNAPRNKATGNSSNYNYSSGRLDHLPYQNSLKVDRHRLRIMVLNKTFYVWVAEALLIPGFLPDGLPPINQWSITWRYHGFPSIDPLKDAQAAALRLATGQTTYAREIGDIGGDWEESFDQEELEKKRRQEKGLSMPTANGSPAATAASQPPPDHDEEEREESRDEEETNDLIGSQAEEDTVLESDAVKKKPSPTSKPDENVQATALNGAQVMSLVGIMDKVALKEYPPDGAKKLIEASYPAMDRKLISEMVESVAKHQPPSTATTDDAEEAEEETNV